MANPNTDRSVDLAVPAHVAREHLARADDQPRRPGKARIEALSPRRCRLTVTGPTGLDLMAFKREVEQANPPYHHANERPTGSERHPSNWRDSRLLSAVSGRSGAEPAVRRPESGGNSTGPAGRG